jgi:hypothetical protein
MRLAVVLFSSTLLLAANAASASGADYIRAHGAQGVNLWRLASREREREKLTSQSHHTKPALVVQDNGATRLQSVADIEESNEFPDQWFTQPIDHFSNSSDTFEQRYWINTRHYTPGSGGPVIVLDGGETSGEDRVPFLDTGIVEILARATGGVGIVLEHRYYGELAFCNTCVHIDRVVDTFIAQANRYPSQTCPPTTWGELLYSTYTRSRIEGA